MSRRIALALLLTGFYLGPSQARSAEPIALGPAVPVETCAACHQEKHGWLRHLWACCKAHCHESHEQCKESCRFIFGSSGPYLQPNKYRPWVPDPLQ